MSASEISHAVSSLRRAVELADGGEVARRLVPTAYVLPGTADPGLRGADAISSAARQWAEAGAVRLHSDGLRIGVSDAGSSAWAWDLLTVERELTGTVVTSRVLATALLVREDEWRVAAAHWSVPYASNGVQYDLLAAGRIPAGELSPDNPAEVAPLFELVHRGLDEGGLAGLFADRDDVVAIGSAEGELFVGDSAAGAWREFASMQPQLAVRGGFDGAVSPDGATAWLATHIDISFGGPVTGPYRFFFVWHQSAGVWRAVVSHDSISLPAVP